MDFFHTTSSTTCKDRNEYIPLSVKILLLNEVCSILTHVVILGTHYCFLHHHMIFFVFRGTVWFAGNVLHQLLHVILCHFSSLFCYPFRTAG